LPRLPRPVAGDDGHRADPAERAGEDHRADRGVGGRAHHARRAPRRRRRPDPQRRRDRTVRDGRPAARLARAHRPAARTRRGGSARLPRPDGRAAQGPGRAAARVRDPRAAAAGPAAAAGRAGRRRRRDGAGLPGAARPGRRPRHGQRGGQGPRLPLGGRVRRAEPRRRELRHRPRRGDVGGRPHPGQRHRGVRAGAARRPRGRAVPRRRPRGPRGGGGGAAGRPGAPQAAVGRGPRRRPRLRLVVGCPRRAARVRDGRVRQRRGRRVRPGRLGTGSRRMYDWIIDVLFWVAVVFLVGVYVSWRATRLDRLHVRVETARAALDAALVRRAAATLELAASRLLDPATSLVLATAAHEARIADADNREIAESDLSRALRAAVDQPDLAAARADSGAAEGVPEELPPAAATVAYARRFYNDAVSQARIARRKLLIRALPLAGRAPLPDFFEIDDDPPSIDLPEPAAPAADRPETGRPGTGRADPAARD